MNISNPGYLKVTYLYCTMSDKNFNQYMYLSAALFSFYSFTYFAY